MNNSPRGAYGGNYGGYNDRPFGGTYGDPRMGTLPPNYSPETAYNDIMRDIGRLRAQVGDDKDLQRELQDLVQKAQQLDPRHMTNEGQLAAIVGAQAMSEVDEVELVLRRKLQATDGSVRSTNPRNTPPGYSDSVAEYYKRLSQQ